MNPESIKLQIFSMILHQTSDVEQSIKDTEKVYDNLFSDCETQDDVNVPF